MCLRKYMIFLVPLSSRRAHVLLRRTIKPYDHTIVFFIKMFLFYDGRIKITSNNGAVKTNFWVTLKESY